MKYTKYQKREIAKFRNYIKQNQTIRRKLRFIAGWKSEDFKKIIKLLELGEQANREYIKKLIKGETETY